MRLRSLLSPAFVLFLADCAAVLSACILGFGLRFITSSASAMRPGLYAQLLPWLALFPLLYLSLSLYPGTFLRRPEELKRQCIATTVGFMGLAFFIFLSKSGASYSRIALLLSWLFSIFTVPLFRHAVRRYCARFPWWATPCVMFGSQSRLPELCANLIKAKSQGIRPAVLVLDDTEPLPDISGYLGHADAVAVERVPLDDPQKAQEAVADIARRYAKAYAVVSFDSSSTEKRQAWLDVIDHCFQRIVIIPDLSVGGRVWVMAVSIGRLSGIMVRQNLLDPHRMRLKRGIDLLLTLIGGGVAFPLLFALALAVRFDSKGPVLFCHTRIGRNGKHFKVFKFRTMAVDSAALLERHLAENPDARREWEETQKLKNDPRITRVGRFLRKTSLDELPQLINVLRGEMSLVGPRPIVDEEIARYGKDFDLYTRVRPGITGLWQTSGRNDLSYEDRIWLDRHYVCNWSVWLDILILVRTVPEVLHCSGAY
ncbi:undecaprenyl-phosphate galactose phosphotransferase WbaP [Desulfovibrio sp. OttesenSCG-928-O18]|nr:undecaprenyl-phosphate galactose phosphotransferase WbaP [Desulfovibrio sp. OttesenSCG-928-O18]